MAQSNYDLLTGISEGKLNEIVAFVFSKPHVRTDVFQGSDSGEQMGQPYRIDWQILTAPRFSLAPPSEHDWTIALHADGTPLPRRDDAFLVEVDRMHIKVAAFGKSNDTTFPVRTIATVAGAGGRLRISTLGIIVDLSGADQMARFVIRSAVIPQVMAALDRTLSGIELPELHFSGQSFTPPVVEARDGYLLTAFNLTKDGAPAIGDAPVESGPFFARMSRELMQRVVDHEVNSGIRGKTFTQTGREAGGGFAAQYSVWGRIDSLSVSTTTDPRQLTAKAGLSMSASAGIDLPVGQVIDALGNVGKEIGKGFEKAGKAIINPDTWNPTKW